MAALLDRFLLYLMAGASTAGAVVLGVFSISASPADDAWYDDLARTFWIGPSVLRFGAGLVALLLAVTAIAAMLELFGENTASDPS